MLSQEEFYLRVDKLCDDIGSMTESLKHLEELVLTLSETINSFNKQVEGEKEPPKEVSRKKKVRLDEEVK